MKQSMPKLFTYAMILVLVVSFLPAWQASAAPITVFINEIHYDNTSGDTGEAIEIAGPAGTDLTGWRLVLYNGNGGGTYDTINLSGVIPDQQNGYGTLSFPRSGIQNGAPDGMALVDASSNVIQFLSYEGSFAATDGPANGLTSVDIGVSENGSGAVGNSLQLTGTGTSYEDFTWAAEAPNTFGAVNTGQTFGLPPAPFINEIHYDNASTDVGEAIEIAGPAGTDLTGWRLVLYNGSGGGTYGTINLIGVIPDQQNGYGTLSFPRSGIQNGSPDGMALVDAADNVIQFLSYEGSFAAVGGPANGMTSEDIGVSEPSTSTVGDSLQLNGTGTSYADFTWTGPIPNTFGAVNTGQTFGTSTLPPDFVSIHDIQYTTDASGDSPYAGQTVTTEGIVTGFFYNGGNKYTFIQDGTGAWSGLVLYKPDVFINVGDKLQVHGQVSEYSGLTEIAYGTVTVLSSGNSLPVAEKLPAGDVSQEMWEAVLVRVENVFVTDPDLGYGEWQVSDGSGGVVVDDLGYYAYTPVLDALLSYVQGPLYFSFGAFKIEPRDDLDIGAPVEILPIGTVQGSVSDTDDGATFAAPYAGQTVTIQGVIYENLLSQTSSGSTNHAFFLQNTTATADGDPNSSDGIYVYIGYYSNLRVNGGGYYAPQVGDEVILQGPISEYYNMTEIGNPYVLKVFGPGVVLDDEVPAFDVNPPDDLADANRYWERREGMRGQIPAGSIVLGGRNVFSPSDAEVWVARADSTIGQRTTAYTNRAFRDAHPLDDNYDPLDWDGNGYRILMGSYGVKTALNDPTALLAPARTFDTLTAPAVGGLYFDYGKYSLEPDQQIVLGEGVDPAQNNPPTAIADRSTAYNIADYNLENLYDYRDNPFSGCDFAGDSGCPKVAPFLASVSSPFNYVPASDAAYQARLNDISQQIINDLHGPDILMVQEVENQDICIVTGGALDCGTTDNADGKPDVLQELALKIAANGGPAYDAAFDRDSSDLRGIAPAFLYRTDRVQLVDPTGDPLLGTEPAIPGYTSVPLDADVSNPKTLNAVYTGTGACETSWVFPRAPDVGLFRIWSAGIGLGSYRDVYVINNHFKSGPDSCVAHRTEQANYNAALVAFIQEVNPYARIVVGGDLNVYPRPDDPFAPIGQPGASDQLGSLYDPALGLKNLWEVILDQAPESAYSYVYVGMAQTLDQMFINAPMLADLTQFRIAHINSDFPADYPGDVARGTSDHDPNVATFAINFSGFFPPVKNPPAVNAVKAGKSIPVKFSLGGYQGLDIFASGFPQSVQVDCSTGAVIGDPVPALKPGKRGLSYDPLTDLYNFVWKTKKSWSKTCRQLIVMFKEGTVQTATFKLK